MTLRTPLTALALAAALVAPAGAQQSVSDDGTSANGPITILKNLVAEGDGVSVRINGQSVDNLQAATYDDITTIVQSGTNTLTVSWDRPVQRIDFKVDYAATRNAFRDVAHVQLDAAHDARLRRAGALALTFTIPGR